MRAAWGTCLLLALALGCDALAADPPRLTPPAETATPAPQENPGREIAKLFAVIRQMRQHLTVTGETAFYIGRRQVKLMTYPSHLYLLAEKWVASYRQAVKRLKAMPIADYLDRPERFVELQDAIRWGQARAIGEPWYFKKGYRHVRIVVP